MQSANTQQLDVPRRHEVTGHLDRGNGGATWDPMPARLDGVADAQLNAPTSPGTDVRSESCQ
jgi:hypothetical protein